jgi:hypothetical protein
MTKAQWYQEQAEYFAEMAAEFAGGVIADTPAWLSVRQYDPDEAYTQSRLAAHFGQLALAALA